MPYRSTFEPSPFRLRRRGWMTIFPLMLKRRTFRILLPGINTFFMDRGPQMGVISEFGRAFEDWINARHKTGTRSFHITLVRAVIAITGIERAKEIPVSQF